MHLKWWSSSQTINTKDFKRSWTSFHQHSVKSKKTQGTDGPPATRRPPGPGPNHCTLAAEDPQPSPRRQSTNSLSSGNHRKYSEKRSSLTPVSRCGALPADAEQQRGASPQPVPNLQTLTPANRKTTDDHPTRQNRSRPLFCLWTTQSDWTASPVQDGRRHLPGRVHTFSRALRV